MGFRRKRTSATLMWLDFYGVFREVGANAFRVQEIMDAGGDEIDVAMAEMAAASEKADNEAEAITDAVGGALMGIGVAVLALAPPVSTIVGAVIAAVGAIVMFFSKLFYVECDKYHCTGYDRNTKTERKIYRRHRQSIVGVGVPGDWFFETQDNCHCEYKGHTCSFIRYMHDGLVIDGLNKQQMGVQPLKTGRVRGVNAIGGRGNKGCTEHWRQKEDVMPLDGSGNPLKKGEYYGQKDAFKSAKGTYYNRAFKVTAVLYWMQERLLCRTMKCMEEVLVHTQSAEGDSSSNQKRRRGSRWYATIVWMMNDIWENGKELGWDKLEELARQVGAKDSYISDLHKMRDGHVFPPDEMPFEWWPFLRHFTFWQLRDLLILMKPLMPYKPPMAPEMPEGEGAREQVQALRPMIMPIKTNVRFLPNMQPVPVKIGSRGPGVGTYALGVGAMAVGSYALYKLISS